MYWLIKKPKQANFQEEYSVKIGLTVYMKNLKSSQCINTHCYGMH